MATFISTKWVNTHLRCKLIATRIVHYNKYKEIITELIMRINFIKTLFALAVLLLCSTSLFAHDFYVGGIYYNITSSTEKTVEVTYGGSSYSFYTGEYSGSVVIPETVTYESNTYKVTSIGSEAFRDCDGLTSVVIGNGVTSIGVSVFYDCFSLTSVTVPNSVTSIGDGAFSYCGSMEKIICNAITPPTCGTQVFDYIDKNTTTLMVPNGAMSAYQSAAQWSDFFNIEHIPTSIEGVKADARGDGTSPVYNLQGVRVQGTDNLPAGIYIRGGKKFMVK